MNEKPKSKLSWRLLRWGLIGLAGLVTLAALLLTEENWRGKHAWENYKHAAEARGEKLDLASVIPPAVPDDQNFFCAPIVAEALSRLGSDSSEEAKKDFRMNFQIYRGDMPKWINKGGYWQKGITTDLTEWQSAIRKFNATPEGRTNGFPVPAQPQSPANDVLAALSVYNPALEELRQAAARPAARMPLDYEDGFENVSTTLPWLAEQKRCAQLLQLRALAELQNEQPDAALSDIKLLLRLSDTTRNQPFLISHLVRIAIQAIALQPIYEGLAQHRWNDAQLADLESALSARDFLADFQIAMRGERMCGISTLETWRSTGEDKTMIDKGVIVTNSMRWTPSVFFYRSALNFALMYDQFILPLVDDQKQTVSLGIYRSGQKFYQEQTNHYSPYKILAVTSFQSGSKAFEKFALIQSQVDLASVACALERFRLAHGNYPGTLDAVAPQFIEKLPHDIINGQQLHYHRDENDKFVVYSVGLNETDDGGTIVLFKGGTVDYEKGDWVWKY